MMTGHTGAILELHYSKDGRWEGEREGGRREREGERGSEKVGKARER